MSPGPRVTFSGAKNAGTGCVPRAAYTGGPQSQHHMFIIEQINEAHDRLGNAATLPEYVRALNSIGVTYSSYVTDGHSQYFGTPGTIVSAPAHKPLTIADTSNREQFLEHLHLHEQQKSTYLEMSKGLADSGVEKWTVDANAMTMTYYDKAGNEMLLEVIS